MGLFDDFGKSFSRPFQQFTHSWGQLFSDPTKMNLGDIFTVVAPGIGALTVNAIKNPWDVAYEAGTFAAVVTGAGLIAPSGVAVGSVTASTPAGFSGLLVPEAALGGSMAASSAVPLTAAGVAGTGGIAGAGTAAGAAGGSGAGFFATLAGAGKAVGSFVVKAAAVSAAAREIMSPWQKAINTAREAIAGGSGGGGTSVHVGSGGGMQQPGDKAQPVQASSANILTVGLMASAVGALAWYLLKPGKR